jgi:uncharacterized membrane protein
LDLNAFLQEFFFNPILNPSVQGYNLINTLIYGIILLLISFYVLFPLLKKNNIPLTFKFFLALIPFICIGVTLRALNAFGLFQKTINPFEFNFYTFTPGVWFLTAFLVIIGLIFSKIFSKKFNKNFELILALIGIIFYLPLLALYLFNFINPFAFIFSLLFIAVTSFISIKLISLIKKNFFENKLNSMALIGQAMDACATVYAIELYNFSEQHPLSDFILKINPFLFILIKVALITLIIYYVDKDVSDKKMNSFIKIFLAILGFATGLASVFKLGLIGC